jgi:hypothetical protein
MWFSVYDYPNFVDFMLRGETLDEGFKRAGFKTYRYSMGKRYWLDDHEFTFFVLRYS